MDNEDKNLQSETEKEENNARSEERKADNNQSVSDIEEDKEIVTANDTEEQTDDTSQETKKAKLKQSIIGTVKFVLGLAAVWVVLYVVTHYFYGFIVVDGESMKNTLEDGQVGIIQKYDKKGSLNPQDIVVFWSDEMNEYLIKRCVAVGGDTLSMSDGVLTVNGEVIDEDYIREPMTDDMDFEELTLEENQIFAMGDNRNHSWDCRELGPVEMEDVTGIMVVNLGKIGITRTTAVVLFIVLVVLLLIVGLLQDLAASRKIKTIPEEFRDFEVEIDSSTCTGEMTIGFRNPKTHQLELMELVKDNKDIKAYCNKYAQEYRHLLKR